MSDGVQARDRSTSVRATPVLCHFCGQVADHVHWHHPDRVADPNFTVPVHPRCHQEHHGIEYRDLGAYETVKFLAIQVDEFESVRIAQENRLRSALDYGLGEDRIEAARVQLEEFKLFEKRAVKALEVAVAETPLGAFIAETNGLGAKTVGRLLGCIGDPAWHSRYDRPRGLYELNAYVGMHTVVSPSSSDSPPAPADNGLAGDGRRSSDNLSSIAVIREAPRKRRGQTANWNQEARKRLYVIAEGCLKNRNSAYRAVYDEARVKYEAREDNEKWRVHKRAMRAMMKKILKDLWQTSRVVDLGGHDSQTELVDGSDIVELPFPGGLDTLHFREGAPDLVASSAIVDVVSVGSPPTAPSTSEGKT